MRHRKGPRKLGRTSSHRKAMLQNMAGGADQARTDRTTLPKAKNFAR